MTRHTNHHLPSPEFRASLEREVVQAFRRQSQFSAPPGVSRRARMRTVAALVLGVSVGVGGAVATAQVQSGKVRDSLTLSAELEQKIQMLKLEVALANYQNVKKSVDAGARSRIDLGESQFDVARAEWLLTKTRLDIEEIKATNRAPNVELWSPIVDGRDFVTERLKAEAAFLTGKAEMVEQQLAEKRAKVAVGVIAASDTLDDKFEVLRSDIDLGFVAKRLEWRKQFLDKKIDQQALADATVSFAYQSDFRAAVLRYQNALQRAKRAKELQTVGAATAIDLKRAELDVMEMQQKMQQLQNSLKALEAAQTLKKKN